MSTQSVENPTSPQDLMEKAEKALTPDQYIRMKDKAFEKIGKLKLISMSLDELKAELPKVVSGDPEEQDILTRLEVAFPWIKKSDIPQQSVESKSAIKFTEHPIDWTTDKISKGVDAITPDRFKEVGKMNKNGASSVAIVTTALLWVSAGATIEMAGKTTRWWDKLKSDPTTFFKELWEVITSGSWTKIASFFSGHMDSMGISTTTVEKFADTMWLPTGLIKTATSLFSTEKFGSMSYESLSKIWKQYQKTPDMDMVKELWIPIGDVKNAVSILEKLFAKDANDIVDRFVGKGGKETEIASLSMTDIIKKIAG